MPERLLTVLSITVQGVAALSHLLYNYFPFYLQGRFKEQERARDDIAGVSSDRRRLEARVVRQRNNDVIRLNVASRKLKRMEKAIKWKPIPRTCLNAFCYFTWIIFVGNISLLFVIISLLHHRSVISLTDGDQITSLLKTLSIITGLVCFFKLLNAGIMSRLRPKIDWTTGERSNGQSRIAEEG